MDSIEDLKLKIDKFNKARDWDQFHTPANLAKSIIIEAAELLECFQWNDNDYDLKEVKEELADIVNYCIQLSMVLNLDLIKIVEEKMMKNAKKYPISKSKGSSLKYDKLDEVKDSKEIKKETKKEAIKPIKNEIKSEVLTKNNIKAEKEIKKAESKDLKKTETKEAKKTSKPKIKGYSAYESNNDKKFFFNVISKTLINNDKKYKDLSKKKIIDEIIKYYSDDDLINYSLSEEEILFLKVNSTKTADINDPAFRFLKELMLFTDKDKKLAITEELISSIGMALIKYKENKAEIEEKKENAYLLVGILRVFGALSNSEINKILSKYTSEEIGDFFKLPYAVRHIEYKDEYGMSYFALRDLGLDAVSLIETHNENIKCNYTKKELVAIGKAYFNIHSTEYKNVAKNPKSIALIQKIDKEELIRAAGRGEELKVHIMEFYTNPDMTEKERTQAYDLMKSLPRYVKY